MANWHFAKLADVWKHLILCETLAMRPPSRYLDTHAGSGFYPLTPDAQRSYGVYWFLEHEGSEPVLLESEYGRLLSRLPGANGIPTEYPGSAMLAMLALGADARYVVCDTDSDSVATLRTAAARLGVEGQVKVVTGDGLVAVQAEAASESDVSGWTIHIDPFEPFDAHTPGGPSPVELARELIARDAVVVYWYGYEAGESQQWAKEELGRGLGPNRSLWCGFLRYPEEDSDSPIIGCGVCVSNVAPTVRARLDDLGRGLASIYENALLPSGGRGSVAFRAATS